MPSLSLEATATMSFRSRAARIFFMHIGSFVAVIVYFYLCEQATYSTAGVRTALLTSLIVMAGYVGLAYSQKELKQFDFGLLAMFAVGTLGAYLGVAPAPVLFQRYSAAVLFITLGLVAFIPLLLGRETFTYYYARRQTPLWQQKLPEFAAINRVMTLYWALLFFVSASLCLWSPQDWRFTALYPNLLIFVAGIPATLWLPPLYLRVFPPDPPQTVEPVIMGMPFVFNRQAAGDTRATIQFHVSGPEEGSYYVRIARGKCESFAGVALAPDLAVYTPDFVWLRIARGELDGAQALQEGQYRAEGDFSLLMKLGDWFSRQR